MRLALTTDWAVEGIPGLLTRYRVVPSGLSAATEKQLAAWERLVTKLTPVAPAFMARHAGAARAYQLRYLARRAVTSGNGPEGLARIRAAFGASSRPLWEEPVKTLTTVAACAVLAAFGPGTIASLRRLAARGA